MSLKPETSREQNSSSQSCRQAVGSKMLISMTLLDNRSPLFQSPRVALDDVTSVPPSSLCSLKPPLTARLFPGAAYSRLTLFQRGSESPPKKRCSSSPGCSSTYNLTTNQRASRSQKWAGADATLRTAWIKSPILPGFSLNDPPAVRSSKQSPEAAAVERDVWS